MYLYSSISTAFTYAFTNILVAGSGSTENAPKMCAFCRTLSIPYSFFVILSTTWLSCSLASCFFLKFWYSIVDSSRKLSSYDSAFSHTDLSLVVASLIWASCVLNNSIKFKAIFIITFELVNLCLVGCSLKDPDLQTSFQNWYIPNRKPSESQNISQ